MNANELTFDIGNTHNNQNILYEHDNDTIHEYTVHIQFGIIHMVEYSTRSFIHIDSRILLKQYKQYRIYCSLPLLACYGLGTRIVNLYDNATFVEPSPFWPCSSNYNRNRSISCQNHILQFPRFIFFAAFIYRTVS